MSSGDYAMSEEMNVHVFTFNLRLVHCGKQNSQLGGGDVLSFGTRSGTRNGVETHIFRVETQRDLAYWSRALVQGSHGAVALVKEVTCCKFCLCVVE